MEALIRLAANVGVLFVIVGVGSMVVLSWVLVLRAFRENVFWGVACLLFPIAAFLFVIRYWFEMKRLATAYMAATAALLAGLGMVSLAPDLRSTVMGALHHQQVRFAALKEGADPEPRTAEARARRELQERREKQAREVAELTEKQKRAAELFVLLKAWHDELMSRQPGEEASETEKARFADEHANYSGLLKEYKQASEEIRERKSTIVPAEDTPSGTPEVPQEASSPPEPETMSSSIPEIKK